MIDTVYVLSSGFSGSTLLDLLLGSHSRVVSLGEITYLPRSFVRRAECTCGAPVPECGFWREVMTETGGRLGMDLLHTPYALDLGMMRATHHVDENKQTLGYVTRWRLEHGLAMAWYRFGKPRPEWLTPGLTRTTRNNFELFDVVRRASGADVVVDSSKAYIKGLSLYQARPERVRFILLSRDGRGVLHSRLKRGVRRERALHAWRSYYERAMPLLERMVPSEHIFRLRYEELVEDAAGRLAETCAFLGLAFEPGMLDFSSKVHHMPEGNDTRLASSEIRRDVAWQTGLAQDDLAFFMREGAALNRRLGHATEWGVRA